MVFNMAVNNSSLSGCMNEGNIDGILLWSRLQVRYDSDVKLDHIKIFYREKIRSLKLKAGGSLVKYIEQFQVL